MTSEKAAQKAENIIINRLTGAKRQRREHLRRIKAMMRWLFKEHKAVVGTTLKAKHIRQYFMAGPVADMSPATRYEHWLSCRKLLQAIDKFDHWIPYLHGPWERPNGQKGPIKTGRPERKITNKYT